MVRDVPEQLEPLPDGIELIPGRRAVQTGLLVRRRILRAPRVGRSSGYSCRQHRRRFGRLVPAVRGARVSRFDPLLCIVSPLQRGLDGLLELGIDVDADVGVVAGHGFGRRSLCAGGGAQRSGVRTRACDGGGGGGIVRFVHRRALGRLGAGRSRWSGSLDGRHTRPRDIGRGRGNPRQRRRIGWRGAPGFCVRPGQRGQGGQRRRGFALQHRLTARFQGKQQGSKVQNRSEGERTTHGLDSRTNDDQTA